MPFAQLTLLDVLQTCPHKCITLLNPQLLKERGVLSHGFLPLCAGFLRRDGIPCHRTTLSHCFFHIIEADSNSLSHVDSSDLATDNPC